MAPMKTRMIVLMALVAWVASGAYMIFLAARWQLDLRVYRGAAQLLVHGGDPMTASFTPTRLEFTYTPFALLLFTGVSFGPFGLVETLWWFANAAALVLTLFLLIEADHRAASTPFSPERVTARRRSLAIAALVAGLATLVLEPVRIRHRLRADQLLVDVVGRRGDHGPAIDTKRIDDRIGRGDQAHTARLPGSVPET